MVLVHGSYDLSDIPGNLIGLDIGPKSIESFKNVLSDSNTILWNGPLGLFENKNLESGTLEIATYLSEIKLDEQSCIIIGGGGTAAALYLNLISNERNDPRIYRWWLIYEAAYEAELS